MLYSETLTENTSLFCPSLPWTFYHKEKVVLKIINWDNSSLSALFHLQISFCERSSAVNILMWRLKRKVAGTWEKISSIWGRHTFWSTRQSIIKTFNFVLSIRHEKARFSMFFILNHLISCFSWLGLPEHINSRFRKIPTSDRHSCIHEFFSLYPRNFIVLDSSTLMASLTSEPPSLFVLWCIVKRTSPFDKSVDRDRKFSKKEV